MTEHSDSAQGWLALLGTLFLIAVCVLMALESWGMLGVIRFTIDGKLFVLGG